jgi:hypothetical protein
MLETLTGWLIDSSFTLLVSWTVIIILVFAYVMRSPQN